MAVQESELLLQGGGAYLNYQMSKTDTTQMSDLTLANLEAMADPIILDHGQTALIPNCHNARKSGCTGTTGVCEINNNGGW